ncbi:MAG: aspartate aminotransferase family protein [Rhodospirillales bacterium]|nr:aspartate aminotransferase family protein [Rhodospirillales bacterium]
MPPATPEPTHDDDPVALLSAHINPRLAQVLRLIGFDKRWHRARGAYLWDDQGTQYLDLLAGYGVFNVGRNHPGIRDALIDHLASEAPSLVQLEAPLLAGRLAERLKRLVDNRLERVYFTSSGHEGIETAIKFARAATGRSVFIRASAAFHGLSSGALALNGTSSFREPFGAPTLQVREVAFNDLGALEAALGPGDVAAFIVEPVQGKRVAIAAPGYLSEAARLCRRHGTLFVVDEVQTGLGRTGRMFAFEHDRDADPDMIVLSKALSGGFVPVGAVLYRKSIYDRVYSSLDRCVVHSSTFGQGALAMAAGLAALDVIEQERLPERATRLGDRLGAGLSALKQRNEFVRDVRWRGLMLGIEFGPPRSLALRTGWTLAHKLDQSLFCQAVIMPLFAQHHMITQVAGPGVDIIKLIPPLVIDETDVDRVIAAFDDVLTGLLRFPGPAWHALTSLAQNALRS